MTDYDYEDFEYDDEDLVLAEEDDDLDYETDDEDLVESAEYDDDDLAERRRFWSRRRRPRRVRAGRTGIGRGLFRPRPTGKYVTQAQLQAGLARVGRDIRKNGAAVRRVAAQVNRTNRSLSAANARQNRAIARTRRDLKKQSDMMLFLTLLQPELKTEKASVAQCNSDGTTSGCVDVIKEVKREDNLLPLLLIMGLGGGGGLGGGDSMTTMLLLLALSDKL